MTTQLNTQIHALFPSNKVGLFVEDCTRLDKPKIRIALVPTKDGSGEPVEFYLDLAIARVFFNDLTAGRLPEDALFKTVKGKNNKEIKAFDLFAKIGENGHRSLTVTNMPDGIALKIIKKNGNTAKQAAYLSSFQTRTIGQAVTAYIQQIDLITLLNPNQTNDDSRDGFGTGEQDNDFPG